MLQSTALSILRSGMNVFLTGSAGSGKTYTLNQYIRFLKQHGIPVAITASTGIAATHLSGRTIHTWSGIGIKDAMSPADLHTLSRRRQLVEQITQAKVLIIDEISMLHARQLELIQTVLRALRKDERPFGGLQLVLCGDFLQLPPVGKKGENNRDKFAFMAPCWLEANVQICYLTESHRQQNNSLNSLLNGLRTNSLTSEHLNSLRATAQQTLTGRPVRLYTHNIDVDAINQRELQQLSGTAHRFVAATEGKAALVDTLVKNTPVSEFLELKAQAQVMFVKNNPDNGYYNGTLGEVISFKTVLVQNTGEEARTLLLPVVRLRNQQTLVVEPEVWSIEDEEGEIVASMSQIPLRLAWAITVHKSQGMTLDAAEINLKDCFEPGQGYVALSRLRDLQGLQLLGFNDKALQLDPLALKADRRFAELSEQLEADWLQRDDHALLHEQFLEKAGGSKPLATKKEAPKPSTHSSISSATKGHSVSVSVALFKEGLSPEAIADQRKLTPGTIIGHLIQAAEQDASLDLRSLLPDRKVQTRIVEAYQALMTALERKAASRPETTSAAQTDSAAPEPVPTPSPISLLYQQFDKTIPFYQIRLSIKYADEQTD